MNLSTITTSILNNVKLELEKEENVKLIKEDLLKPMIQHTMDELYPYFLKCMVVIMIILLFLIVTVFLNLKIILK
jgi:hypothetical protein